MTDGGAAPDRAPGEGLWRSSRQVLSLAWTTNPRLTVGLALATLLAGVLPAGIAWVGKAVVDGAIAQVQAAGSDPTPVLRWIAVEGVLLALLLGSQRGSTAWRTMLGLRLGDRVATMIMRKASRLGLSQFEDPEVHDHLARTRREANTRPLSLLQQHFALIRDVVALTSYGAILLQLSPLALLVVIAAGLPGFWSELRFARAGFELARRRAETRRERTYLENLLARGDFAKEVKSFGLGGEMLSRHGKLVDEVYADERRIIARRERAGFLLGLFGLGALYGAYVWVAIETVNGNLSIGSMTMYLVVFRQAQSTVTTALTTLGGMYENHLYLSDLRALMDLDEAPEDGEASAGPDPGDGVRFEDVTFHYPDMDVPALSNVSLHARPGETLALVGVNGSGKSTLIKMLVGLYHPDQGRILLEGRPVEQWSAAALRAHVSPLFQDYNRFKLTAGENIGLGDVEELWNESRWAEAARAGMAEQLVEDMPERYHTRLGRWFRGGHELSAGQWQRLALARTLMRPRPRVIILDEPTSALDPEAEAAVLAQVRERSPDAVVVLVSHRLSTVRTADRILRLEEGRIAERGTHEELMESGGAYARQFEAQAGGYREP